MNTGKCNCNKCNGERIVVNQNRGCGCGGMRSQASCQNMVRPNPSCCAKHVKPCRPRPCPAPSCKDRCKAQFCNCMNNCRKNDQDDCNCQGHERWNDFDDYDQE